MEQASRLLQAIPWKARNSVSVCVTEVLRKIHSTKNREPAYRSSSSSLKQTLHEKQAERADSQQQQQDQFLYVAQNFLVRTCGSSYCCLMHLQPDS